MMRSARGIEGVPVTSGEAASDRGAFRTLLLLFLLSLGLHLAYLFSPLASANLFSMDESMYWDLAASLAEKGELSLPYPAFETVGGGERTLFWTPGYPLLLAFALKTGLPANRVVQLIQILMASCAPLLLYPVARAFLNGRRLWIFLTVSACYPYYYQLATQTASETLALFLSLACLGLALGPAARSFAAAALLGTLAAWLSLTRPEFLAFSLVTIGWLVFRWMKAGEGGSRVRAAALIAAFSLWMGAWLYRNMDVTGTAVFTTRSGYSLAYQNEYYHLFSRGEVADEAAWTRSFPELGSEIDRYHYLRKRAAGFILGHPGIFVALSLKRLASIAIPQEAKGLLLGLMGRRDPKPAGIPPWYRLSNAVFLAGLWLLVLPSLIRFLPRLRRCGFAWSGPEGLLLLLVLGQVAVYALFAYIEYQRSIMDMEILLLGLVFRQAAGSVAGEGKPGSDGGYNKPRIGGA